MATASQVRRIRFGAFEVDLASGELFKHGIRIKLQDQPFQILTILLERPGELIPREELRRKLWAEHTFVDFDAGMNAAIRRLRDALNDSADQPRYIETLPRHGYRFIAEAQKVYSELDEVTEPAQPPLVIPQDPNSQSDSTHSIQRASAPPREKLVPYWLTAASIFSGIILLLAFGVGTWRHRVFSAHASPRIHSIAVLPLQNLSGDPSQEYFADGMTDALITDLARISSLRVISRTSVFQFKNSQEPLAKIARDLDVDAVIEGSVVRSGNRVRVNAQLIEASADRHIWASTFERDMTDVLTLQDEAARSIVSEIAANLTAQGGARPQNVKPVNPAAYEAFLKAHYFYGKETSEGFEKARKYYEESIGLDPAYAPAYVGLAEVFAWLAYTQRQDPADSWLQAESLLAKALKIDGTSSDAYVMRGMIKLQFRCDRSGAEKDLNYALALDPENVSAIDYHSYYLLETKQMDEAIAEKRRVVALDPVSVGTSAELGLYLLQAGRNEDAIQQLQRTLELDPSFAPAHKRLGQAFANKGQFNEAVAELKKGIALDEAPGAVGLLGDFYAQSGKKQESLEVIAQLRAMSKQRHVSPTLIARIYSRLGDEAQALNWLEKATAKDQPDLSDPGFDGLRSNARFKALEGRLRPEQSCPPF
jgi:TolB-like protein/DNA-binding winged helix-turn-helix (wHTH) protein/Tfp pilus assembly protein PilF